MNKKEYQEARERFKDLNSAIWNGIVNKVTFAQYECSKKNGRITFHNPFDEKEFPSHYFQIGQAGFLDREEMSRFMQATKHIRV